MGATIILIAGGSASGKSTVAQKIANDILKEEKVFNISMDSYYKDFSHLTFEERKKVNFDHPSSINIDLLVQDLKKFKKGETVFVPKYDYKTHTQSEQSTKVELADVVILDGILALHIEEIRNMGDIKLFIKTDDDIRFIRRLERDIKERGRNLNDVINQYLEFVRPMYKFFVEPSIDFADIIIPYYNGNEIAIDLVSNKIKNLVYENNT